MSVLENLMGDDGYGVIVEAYEVAADYELWLKGSSAPKPLRVRILRDYENQFWPRLSHHVHLSGASAPYTPSWHPSPSVEGAMEGVLAYLLTTYHPEDESTEWTASDWFYQHA